MNRGVSFSRFQRSCGAASVRSKTGSFSSYYRVSQHGASRVVLALSLVHLLPDDRHMKFSQLVYALSACLCQTAVRESLCN